jgi:hypothetical protein
MKKSLRRKASAIKEDILVTLQQYFKIGESAEYILMRDDFPIGDISSSDFSCLCREMFKRNDEALHGK